MIYYYFSCWLREWILRLVFRVEFVYYTCFCARYNADVKSLWILKWMFKVQSGFRGFGCVTFSTGCGWNRWFVPMILCEYLGLHHTRDVILKILSRYWNFLLCLGGILLVFRLTARIHSTCIVKCIALQRCVRFLQHSLFQKSLESTRFILCECKHQLSLFIMLNQSTIHFFLLKLPFKKGFSRVGERETMARLKIIKSISGYPRNVYPFFIGSISNRKSVSATMKR